MSQLEFCSEIWNGTWSIQTLDWLDDKKREKYTTSKVGTPLAESSVMREKEKKEVEVMVVVENKRSGVRHLADDQGMKTFCGLSARRMKEIKPPPAAFKSWEEEEKWKLDKCMCARCRSTCIYRYFI